MNKKPTSDQQQRDERTQTRNEIGLAQVNAEIRKFNKEFSVDEPFSAKAYLVARAEYQYESLFSKSLELGEFGKYIKTQYKIAQSKIDIVIINCPSVWEKKGDQYCLSEPARLFGEKHKWENSAPLSSRSIKPLWTRNGSRYQEEFGNAEQTVATKLGEMIRGEEERVRTIAEDERINAEKQRTSTEKRRADAELRRESSENKRELAERQRIAAEATRATAETIRIEAEEARRAEVQRICTEAQEAANKALHAAKEAHQAANAIHGSVIEGSKGSKIQSVSEISPRSPRQENVDQPRWENLPEDPEGEKKAIIAFHVALKEAGWRYSLRDIVRFHTSVRCEPLTILGGAPGSGKSSLARMYASYFGRGDENSFLSIDVQPSWHDRMDFLGFVKTHGDKPEFVDAETGVADFLRKAANAPSGLWLACLEEINLARPEHYFSDFLQRVSLDDAKRKESPINFWAKGKGNDITSGTKEKSLALPIESFVLNPSVRFVGTCNFDETTQNFSERFLDRCNYIELQPVPLQIMFFPGKDISSEITFPKPNWTWRPFSSSSRTRMNEKKEEVQQLLDKLAPKGENRRGVLQKLGITPSPRVVKDIIRYVEARLDTTVKEIEDERNAGVSPGAEDLFSRALDEALLQRILPKLIVVQSGIPDSDTDDIRKSLKETLSPASNEMKLHLCNRFLEKLKSIW